MFGEDLAFLGLVFFVGLVAGFINIMAGGGSALTLGVLIWLGVDSTVANGTNRIALLVESISGVVSFKKEKYSDFGQSLKFSVCTLPGAILGAIYAVKIDKVLFQRILSGVIIFIIIMLIIPKSKNKVREKRSKFLEMMIYPAMFLVGFYGGFVQAGVGFIIMASLKYLRGLNLVLVNMHKTFIILIYAIPIIIIFGITRNINWVYAVFLASGNALGAWYSAKLSVVKGEKIVKVILGIAMVIMAIKLAFTT